MVSTEEGIAISEICVYVPIFILTAIVVIRHGFQKQLGWIYLSIFCLIRLAGAGFKIESIHNPTNKTDIEWAAILQSVGLSPLLMASMGLLKRTTDEVSNHIRSDTQLPLGGIGGIITKRATANSRRSRIIQIAQLPTMIALILCIVGGIDEADTSPSEIATGKKLTKVGIVIFLIIYILLVALTVITMKDIGNAPRGEKRLYFAVLGAIPYSLSAYFESSRCVFEQFDFSIFSGKPLIQLFMATLEEFVIVVFFTVAGITVSN